MHYTPVPFDPELEAGLAALMQTGASVPLRADTIGQHRAAAAASIAPIDDTIGDRPVAWEDVVIPGPDGAPDITMTLFRPTAGTQPDAAGIFAIHGGGMILGTRCHDIDALIDAVATQGALGVSIEYRLAPEYPAPAAVKDCYTGLKWMSANAEALGFDRNRLLVSGFSAGGGLAAAMTLMARDRGGPDIAAVYLGAPMLDDRNNTRSSHQYDGIGKWDRNSNHTAWSALLGERRGSDDVSVYIAPARATDLSNLPTTFIEVGAAEVFRDEAIDYANRIWATGGQCELHVWAGAYHGLWSIPAAKVTQLSRLARRNWLARTLGFSSTPGANMP